MKPVNVKIDNKDCVIISEKLYSGLVRSLAHKINYQEKYNNLVNNYNLLKEVTNQFNAIEYNFDNNKDVLIIASKTYFNNGIFDHNYINKHSIIEYLQKYDNDSKYSTNQLIKDLYNLCFSTFTIYYFFLYFSFTNCFNLIIR